MVGVGWERGTGVRGGWGVIRSRVGKLLKGGLKDVLVMCGEGGLYDFGTGGTTQWGSRDNGGWRGVPVHEDPPVAAYLQGGQLGYCLQLPLGRGIIFGLVHAPLDGGVDGGIGQLILCGKREAAAAASKSVWSKQGVLMAKRRLAGRWCWAQRTACPVWEGGVAPGGEQGAGGPTRKRRGCSQSLSLRGLGINACATSTRALMGA